MRRSGGECARGKGVEGRSIGSISTVYESGGERASGYGSGSSSGQGQIWAKGQLGLVGGRAPGARRRWHVGGVGHARAAAVLECQGGIHGGASGQRASQAQRSQMLPVASTRRVQPKQMLARAHLHHPNFPFPSTYEPTRQSKAKSSQ